MEIEKLEANINIDYKSNLEKIFCLLFGELEVGAKIYTVYSSGRCGVFDYEREIETQLGHRGYEFKKGNSAPKGGMLGRYLEIIKTPNTSQGDVC